MHRFRPLIRNPAAIFSFGRAKPQRLWPTLTFSSTSKSQFVTGGPQDAATGDESPKAENTWKGTVFKMLETAGTTMASIVILGYCFLSCHDSLYSNCGG